MKAGEADCIDEQVAWQNDRLVCTRVLNFQSFDSRRFGVQLDRLRSTMKDDFAIAPCVF